MYRVPSDSNRYKVQWCSTKYILSKTHMSLFLGLVAGHEYANPLAAIILLHVRMCASLFVCMCCVCACVPTYACARHCVCMPNYSKQIEEPRCLTLSDVTLLEWQWVALLDHFLLDQELWQEGKDLAWGGQAQNLFTIPLYQSWGSSYLLDLK